MNNGPAFPIVDSHHHLWDLSRFPYRWLAPDAPPRRFGDHSAIKRDYLPVDYRADFEDLNLVGSVHVQANCGAVDPIAETAWLQDLADTDGCPSAIVAEVDLTRMDAGKQIKRHMQFKRLRGVRALIAWDRGGRWRMATRPGILSEPAFRKSAATLATMGLSLDLVVVPEQLPEVAQLAESIPDLSIAINHLAQIEPSVPGNADLWHAGIAALADCRSVHMKLSGLWTIDLDWSLERLQPLIDQALEVFGPDRLMYGSNLPVEKVNTGAARQIDVLTEILGERNAEIGHAVLFANATRFYRLDVI
ncbi:MAG: amidohydrolase family protein [Alphaproteobacteria bacterium]|nr:amidohydrolase family protein [Alphaproteobacteria bacterium]